jgi:hypothetical protein
MTFERSANHAATSADSVGSERPPRLIFISLYP